MFKDKKQNIYVFIFSIFESFLQVYGFLLSTNHYLKDFNLKYFIIMLALSVVFFVLNTLLFVLLTHQYSQDADLSFSKKHYLLFWLILFIMWIPVLLAYYPAIWAYDVFRQIPHLTNTSLTSYQPIIHTLFLEFGLIIGKIISGYELGMLLLSIIQMLIMSSIFAYAIEKVRIKLKSKKLILIVTILLLVYYGLMPFNSILSISMTKDVLFSGFLLLIFIYLYDLIDDGNLSKTKKIMYVTVLTLLLLIKNNSLFIVAAFSILALIFFKSPIKKILFYLNFTSITLYYVIFFFIVILLKPINIVFFEAYSVPAQNLIYVHQKHPDEDIIPYDKIIDKDYYYACKVDSQSKIYVKKLADYAKNYYEYCFGNQYSSKEFLTTWVKYGFKYPLDYIDSWSNLMVGSWYLLDETHANIYNGNNQGYLLTDFKANRYILKERPKSKFPWLYNKLELIATDNIQYKYGFLSRFIFAPATYILMFFLLVIYILLKRKREELVPLSLLIALYLSILTGPVIIVRYIYPFMVVVPIMIVRIISQKKSVN